MKNLLKRIHYNSPVILTYALLSAGVLILCTVTRSEPGRLGTVDLMLFSVYRCSWADPLSYIRMFGHVLGHSDLAHYSGNFLLILLIGPMLEEKYGSKRLLLLIACAAFIMGLVYRIAAPPNTAVLGASGIVFMLIILSSFVNMQHGRLPVTLIFVAAIYLGKEVFASASQAVTGANDGVSQFMHIVGGLCGLLFGILLHKMNKSKTQDEEKI